MENKNKMPLFLKESNLPLKMNDFSLTFSNAYKLLYGREFEFTNESKNYYETLLYFFYKDDDFYKSPCLIQNLNTPSLNRGLFIIGNPGVGKTSILKTFEYVFKNLCIINQDFYFIMIDTNKIVSEFESLETPAEKGSFYEKMSKAFRCFDDVKSEREASNYGKANVIREILFDRSNAKKRTIITCNYHDNYPDDPIEALDEIGARYGARIYDRMFEMCNFIEVKGKSFRR